MVSSRDHRAHRKAEFRGDIADSWVRIGFDRRREWLCPDPTSFAPNHRFGPSLAPAETSLRAHLGPIEVKVNFAQNPHFFALVRRI